MASAGVEEDDLDFFHEGETRDLGKKPDGGEAEKCADERAGEHIAEEMHAEDDAGCGDAEGKQEKAGEEMRMKQADGKGDGKGGDGMAGGEREFVGWEDYGPEMRLDFARATAAAEALEEGEEEDASKDAETCGAQDNEAAGAAPEKEKEAEGVPCPAVAEPRGGEHEEAKPAGRIPAIDAAHQAEVAGFDVTPDAGSGRHG